MAEEVEMTPVEMVPVDAAEPPKADPLAKPAAPISETAKAAPVVPRPAGVGAGGALKPGLKLPPKPGTGTAALKPGLKLPPKPGAGGALKPGLKLPPKPGAAGAGAPASGLKLPTQTAARPAVPAKPVIRKPGATVMAQPLPKPITPQKQAAEPAAEPTAATPTPVAVDAQGVGKLPTVEAKAISRDDPAPVVSETPKPLEALKSVTQKLKGITQEIPQQAILRKTGIIADGAMSDAQKEAAKHKTARISLSDAIGVAPVKNENAPIKTIRIKRPVDIPGGAKPPAPVAPAAADAAKPPASEPAAAEGAANEAESAQSPTMTQRKTLKITRPGGGALRPGGKFGIKRPGAAPTRPAAGAAPAGESPAGGEVAEIGRAHV